ncbi:MAG: 2-C-methyl-D-erythritol 4-phosphate cytidylyltransferase [Alistipes sp.]|nr:2-C-methyl-D-erythritol 4-phosphate cytidylyltransferase [Alistipes sp.]
MPRVGVVIVAGGAGTRCGGRIPKQFALLGGEPVLARTIGNFARALPEARIVVVLPAEHIDFWRNLRARFDVAPHEVAAGGAERFDSVRNGLAALPADVELIAVQDAVRPLGTPKLIRRTVAVAAEYGTAIPAVEAVDSYREVEGGRSRAKDRGTLRIVQTPQVFRADVLREAYRTEYCAAFTDDASVVERAGHAVRLCEGERRNLKITTPEDFAIAEALLAAGEETDYRRLPEE